MTPIFYGVVKKGRIEFEYPDDFKKHVWSLEDKYVKVTVQKRKKERTLPQNRYYWGVVIKISADFFGYSKEECHDAFKFEFLRKGQDEIIDGKPKPPTCESTTKLSTIEMNEYIEKIKHMMSTEYGVYIPDPNEVQIDYNESVQDELF